MLVALPFKLMLLFCIGGWMEFVEVLDRTYFKLYQGTPRTYLSRSQLWGQEALMLFIVSAPVLGVILVVNFSIGWSLLNCPPRFMKLLLAFAPKPFRLWVVPAIGGPWILTMVVEYIRRVLMGYPPLYPDLAPQVSKCLRSAKVNLRRGCRRYFWPFLRTLAVFTSAPVFSSRAFPLRAKIALAIAASCSGKSSGDACYCA